MIPDPPFTTRENEEAEQWNLQYQAPAVRDTVAIVKLSVAQQDYPAAVEYAAQATPPCWIARCPIFYPRLEVVGGETFGAALVLLKRKVLAELLRRESR